MSAIQVLFTKKVSAIGLP